MADKKTQSKPGWHNVKFGDVVRLSKTRTQDPLAEGFDRYIGLEHLEPGDLHIRSWGNVADGITFTNVFRPGHVLFGKRRAYQRKVALVDFSGVCSGDIYVLESKDPNRLLSCLLPFLCQTDAFFEHAVGTSAGSLSPRTNWSSLASFEFALPSRDEQSRLVKLFEASHGCVEALKWALQAAGTLKARALTDAFDTSGDSEIRNLDSVLERVIDYRGKSPNKSSDGVPLITARNVKDGFIDFSEPEYIPDVEFDSWMTRGLPRTGDILVTTEAPLGNVARVPETKFALAQRIVCLRANEDAMLNDYLFWALRSTPIQRQLLKRATGSTVLGIKQSELRKIEIPVPSIEEQLETSAYLTSLDQTCYTLLSRFKAATRLQKKVLEELQ